MGGGQVESRPSSRILFTTDFENPCQARINVKNLSDHSVLFRVKFKYPEIFFAHPAFGELIPGNQY